MGKAHAVRFQSLLLEYAQEPDVQQRQQLEAQLWAEYGTERVVFVLDMSGFSLLTRRYGIVHYLAMVRRMQLTVEPIIVSFGGSVLEFEADNCLAIFPDALPAVRAAVTMQLVLDASNLLTPDDLDVRISCGIDHGQILIIGDDDCFGDAVNRAYKLGEDVAGPGQILATREAMDRIGPVAGIRRRAVDVSISGLSIPAYSVEYRAETQSVA